MINNVFIKFTCLFLVLIFFNAPLVSLAANDGLSTATAFTSISEAQNVSCAGIHYFNIGGAAFSTYVTETGYVQIALDYGNGNGNLPQVNTISNNRGILNPAILSNLTNLNKVSIKHSGGWEVFTSNADIIDRIKANKTLHAGTVDNQINKHWIGLDVDNITTKASCNSQLTTNLHQNIIHICGYSGSLMWAPINNTQRLIYNAGEIATTESLSLWVLGNKPTLCDNNATDTDNDGVCDWEDVCPNDDDNLIGLPCDDGKSCTINDTWTAACKCTGTNLSDIDNDGICDLTDSCFNFNDKLDLDDDDLPLCADNCVDVDADGICDDVDTAISVDELSLHFSHKRGYYEAAFSLTILSNDANATIKYTTTHTTIPSPVSGTNYSNPINVTIPNNGVFTVKAMAFNATDTTLVQTHSYVFLNQVYVHNDTFSNINADPVLGPKLRQGFLEVPTVSIFVDNDSIINGISDEKISIEWLFHPDLNEGPNHQVDAGVRYSSGGVNGAAPKNSLKIYFRKEYDYAKLEYPLFKNYKFGIEPTDKFDRLYLRNGSHDSTIPGNFNDSAAGTYVRQRFSQDMQLEMGNISSHGRFVQVFVNGTYYGMFHMHERPSRGFMEEYVGGDGDQYDAIRQGSPSSGTIDQYNEMLSVSNNYTQLKTYMNEKSFIDYLLIMFHSASVDYGTNKNWRAAGPSTLNSPTGAEWYFFCWDMDTGLNWYRDIRPAYTPPNSLLPIGLSPGDMYANLKDDLEFKFDFADRIQCNFYDDGPMTKENMAVRFQNRVDEIQNAVIAEHLRWTDIDVYKNKWGYNVDTALEFIELREAFLLSKMEEDDMYPSISAVHFSQNSGSLPAYTNINLTNCNAGGTIYYTTNGEDPRLPGGTVNPNALVYNNPINLASGIYDVFARVHDPLQNSGINKWSAACPKRYYVNVAYNDLVINEIHYNPADSIYFNNTINATDTVDGKNFEFIEIKNTGTEIVNLIGSEFTKGITLKFEESLEILPNGFLVFAEDSTWFHKKYGFAADGIFEGKLDNGGEKLNFKNAQGYFIDTLRYDDDAPWQTIADDGLYSLALIDATTNTNSPANWAVQIVATTPRAENEFCAAISNNAITANISCLGANDGFIANQLTGGTPPFSYSWSNGGNANVASNLPSGQHTVTVTDFYNCPYTETFTITEPPLLAAVASFTNETYYQTNNGTATVNVSGGTSPYSYSWSNGASTTSINNLAPGSYSVSILDANGCPFSETVTINPLICNALAVDVEEINETCLGSNNGSLLIRSVSNGTAPYSVLWSTGITGSVANNLTTGTYQLNVTDNFGCPFQENYLIEVDNIVQASFTINNVSSANLNDGSISAIASGGDAPYTYNWSNGSSSQNLNNVGLGVYSVTVTDANGCAEFFNQLTIDNSCVATIIQQNYPVINSQIYQVAQFIQSNGMVNVNETVSFKAGNYIELTNAFEVIQGAEFEAKIEGCQ